MHYTVQVTNLYTDASDSQDNHTDANDTWTIASKNMNKKLNIRREDRA